MNPTHVVMLCDEADIPIIVTIAYSEEEANKIALAYGSTSPYHFRIVEIDYSLRLE